MLARRDDPHRVSHGNPPDRDRRSWWQDRVDLHDAVDPHLLGRPDCASWEKGDAGGHQAAVGDPRAVDMRAGGRSGPSSQDPRFQTGQMLLASRVVHGRKSLPADNLIAIADLVGQQALLL
jgi:hypothetical protein